MTLTLALLTLHTPECPSGAVLSIGSGAGLTCARRRRDAVRSFDIICGTFGLRELWRWLSVGFSPLCVPGGDN